MNIRARLRHHLPRWGSALVLAVLAVAATTAAAPTASADTTPTTTTIRWTRIGIYPRADASMDSTRVGPALPDGATVSLACEQQGQAVSNGYQTITIWDRLTDGTWLPNAFLDTGSTSWTPGVARCDQNTGQQPTTTPATTPAPRVVSSGDPCIDAYPDAEQHSTDQFGGTRTDSNRAMSLYQVCGGYGAPADLTLTPAMKCALVAAAATYGGPGLSIPVDRACDAADIVEAFQSNDWLGYAGGKACGYFADVFATAGGIAAAGATAETGPGAAAVGVATYKALAASLKVVCGGLFDGGAQALGEKLEADHETDIATDILQHGKCLREDVRFGLTHWSAPDC